MEQLNFVVVGNNDISKICIEEITAAGHHLEVQINDISTEKNNSLNFKPSTIFIFCSSVNPVRINGISLVFNHDFLGIPDSTMTAQQHSQCCWWISFCKKGFFYPIPIDPHELTTFEESIRESFIEILSSLSRNTLNEYTLANHSSVLSGPAIDFKSKNILECFTHTVLAYPQQTALICGDISISYEQLQAIALETAHRIKREHISSPYIALYFKRNINMIVAILATLQLDSTYIPLDPKNPVSRNRLILEDSGVQLILCDRETIEEAKKLSPKVSLFCVDWQQCNLRQAIEHTFSPNNPLAYIIYTSGSTGQPKGVMCTHQGAINMILWTLNSYPIRPEDCIVQLASYAFDISVWEIFAALISGATLVLAKDDGYSDPLYIAQLVSKHKVSIAHMIPTILDIFLDELDHVPCPTLRHVVSGGEELRPSIANKFFTQLPHAHLYHGYGPTECGITVIHHTVKANSYTDYIPIGHPIQNVELYIVDKNQQLALKGAEGELYIRGKDTLALGYLNNSNETQDHFLTAGSDSKDTLYKTGDLVKMLPDNTIKYIGRADHQIKNNGNRIELEEIERVIAQQPSIKAVSVQTIRHHQSPPILIAFCIFNQVKNEALETSRLKEKLQSFLPQYMVPSYFIKLDVLPKTINGKINKIALKTYFEREILRSKSNKKIQSNISSPIETAVLNFLKTELKLLVNDLNHDLVSLGITSIGIIYLISFLERKFRVRLTPAEIFQASSLNAIIEKVSKKSVNTTQFIGQSIPSVSRRMTLPLSHAQIRLWFLHQMEDQKSAAYNILKAYKLVGVLDIRRLELAFNKIIARHEPLRTYFPSVSGIPHQVICDFSLKSIEVEKIQASELNGSIHAFGNHYFDLGREVACKVKLLNIDKETHILLILQHNIITDGWSTGILIKELSYFYNDTSPALVLPELTIQYADYSTWQNKRLSTKRLEKELLYWKSKLNQFVPLELTLDFERPIRQTFNGKMQSISIAEEQVTSIKDFIKRSKVTLYIYLVTVLKGLLCRYTETEDILIGTAYASRDKAELKDIMGFFINVLPLRTKIERKFSFTEALMACQKTILEAISNGEIPFDVLIDRLKIEREPNKSSLFQILFLMQDAADNIALNLSGLDCSEISYDLGTSIFDITFNVIKENKKILITAQYNTDLFSDNSITQLLEHYRNLLIHCALHPQQLIKEIPIINHYDLSIIRRFSADTRATPRYKTIIQWLQTITYLYPEKIALVEGNQTSLTYHQLDELSDQLAHAISNACGEKVSVIALYLEKSIPLLVSIIATIKSGNTYLILDTHMPDSRVHYILSDSKAICLIAHTQLPPVNPEKIPILDYQQAISTVEQQALASSEVLESDNAYILYTSGSTGEPKGVQISHKNLINTLNYFINKLQTDAYCKLLSLTSPSFDIFQLEIFVPLLSGGTCYFFNRPLNLHLDRIEAEIATINPTLIQATPSAWKLIIKQCKEARFNATALVGGENIESNLLTDLQSSFQKVYNLYGPTETTIWSTCAELTNSNRIHLGKPIDNTTVLLVDQNQKLLPVGCIGEIIISGESISKGYVNKPEETEKRFVELYYPNLFNRPERFYKTGDIGRISQDGYLIYLGRRDDQVKIRGYRIELNEITAAINRHTSVKDGVVIPLTQDDNNANQILVSFIVHKDHSVNYHSLSEQLKEYIKGYLPEYMVPDAFILISHVPLNVNGKVDKFKLKALYRASQNSQPISIKPLSKTEIMLQKIWSQSLNIKNPNIEANFFNLGGHSLLIAEVVAMINSQLNTQLTIRQFVNNPTIRKQAQLIEKSKMH